MALMLEEVTPRLTINAGDNHVLAAGNRISLAELAGGPVDVAAFAGAVVGNIGRVQSEINAPKLLNKLGNERHGLDIGIVLALLHGKVDLGGNS